ncbi:TPA: hypothetical protein N0F65_006310 [Lagenidium giganteum]|uniref:Uncharacterized protein n=1 Tax=Lagenidium giganteum TaxID=4803 RepID=A0AAV2YK91_9STRA|nr:TPA: hypothetical protein N0F65_006310 [Lagenidium giganteum]
MTATAKPKAKFSSRNLSAVYKAPRAKPAEVPNAFYPNAHRMLVLGKASVRGNMSASALAAKAHAVAVPTPINTPSLRKEHAGQDVHVHLVPSGRSGWANNGHGGDNGQHEEPQDDADNQTERPVAFPSSATTAKNVWGGGVSGEPAASLTSAPPQQNENQQEAEGISGLVSRGFGKMNSGRWGDDAVEQDIARSDMLRSMEKERQFPQLMHPSADARGDRSDSNANSMEDTVRLISDSSEDTPMMLGSSTGHTLQHQRLIASTQVLRTAIATPIPKIIMVDTFTVDTNAITMDLAATNTVRMDCTEEAPTRTRRMSIQLILKSKIVQDLEKITLHLVKGRRNPVATL